MRKTILALVLAAGALGAATTASEAHYRYNSGYGYDSGYSYGYQQTYYQPHYCHTVSFQVYDEYSCEYVYRTKEVCN